MFIIKIGTIVESFDLPGTKKGKIIKQYYYRKAENNSYNSNVMKEKEKYNVDELVTLDLYNAVVLKSGVCTSNALMFKKNS